MSKLEESAFELTIKEMKQIRYLEMLKKRKTQGKKRFSDKLSMEAQLAMLMALDDIENESEKAGKEDKTVIIQPKAKPHGGSKLETISEQPSDTTSDTSDSRSHSGSGKKSFAELYEENGTRRMKNDITDEEFKPEKLLKRALDPHGKLESAMEIVETVKYDMDEVSSDDDNEFIEQIAKQNSVDKCKVWITANSQEQKLLNIGNSEGWRESDSRYTL